MKHNHVDYRFISGAIRVKNNVERGTVLKSILNQFHKAPNKMLQVSDVVSPPIINSSPCDDSQGVFGTKHGLQLLMGLLQLVSSF